LGAAIAKELAAPFIDADDLHPASNVAKMSRGEPLNDEDREPWLQIVRERSQNEALKRSGPVVVGCSALKAAYRDNLRGISLGRDGLFDRDVEAGKEKVATWFVFIKGSRELLLDRMSKRQGHFMKVGMLDSQLATLEDPTGEPDVVVVRCEDGTKRQAEVAREGLRGLHAQLD